MLPLSSYPPRRSALLLAENCVWSQDWIFAVFDRKMKTRASIQTIESQTARCLAGNLIRLRGEHGLSIKTAAAKLGVAESTWSQWENGKRFPPRHLFDHIVSMFDVPPCVLLSDSREDCPLIRCPTNAESRTQSDSQNVNKEDLPRVSPANTMSQEKPPRLRPSKKKKKKKRRL